MRRGDFNGSRRTHRFPPSTATNTNTGHGYDNGRRLTRTGSRVFVYLRSIRRSSATTSAGSPLSCRYCWGARERVWTRLPVAAALHLPILGLFSFRCLFGTGKGKMTSPKAVLRCAMLSFFALSLLLSLTQSGHQPTHPHLSRPAFTHMHRGYSARLTPFQTSYLLCVRPRTQGRGSVRTDIHTNAVPAALLPDLARHGARRTT
ncbi:hypothetical protein LZ32DRAFT_286755 [Colletotrichum eremochloae]|nr:hypothetical protein LZ32DRAFT_286755 [Colletotrichum eremochloae]